LLDHEFTLYLFDDVYEPLYIILLVDEEISLLDPVIIVTSLIQSLVVLSVSCVFIVVVDAVDVVDDVVDVVVPFFLNFFNPF